MLLTGMLNRQEQSVLIAIEAGSSELTFHGAGGKQDGALIWPGLTRKDPTGILAKDVRGRAAGGAVGDHPDISLLINR